MYLTFSAQEHNAPLAVVEAIVGHSNPAMTRHYTHVGEVAASAAVAAVAALLAIGQSGAAAKAKQPVLKPAKATTAGLADLVHLLACMTDENWADSRDKALAILRGC